MSDDDDNAAQGEVVHGTQAPPVEDRRTDEERAREEVAG